MTIKAWLIEIVPDAPQYSEFMAKSGIKESEFWDVFFRHNNFFIEKNARFFQDMKNKDLVRADSLTNLAIIWICFKAGDLKEMLEQSEILKKKYKLYREIPEYALQQAEAILCPILDGRSKKEEISKLTPEIWFPVLQFLDLKDQLALGQTCRSLYADIKGKAIGKILVAHPDLRIMGSGAVRKMLWLSLLPRVNFVY